MKRPAFSLLLPACLNNYQGHSIAVCYLVAYNLIGTARSLIHIFAPDSGAQSIATMNIHVDGGNNIIGLLAQLGTEQLMMALVIWIVLLRYRIFIPIMIAETAIEQLARICTGHLKHLETMHTPPGAVGSQILLPIALIFLAISMIPARRSENISPVKKEKRE